MHVPTLDLFLTWCSFLLGKTVGEMILFFGCRKKNEDYIYEDELLSYSQDGTIKQLHVAFSRDQVSFLGILEIFMFSDSFLVQSALLGWLGG